MEKTCCFFGHKDTPESVKADLYAAIEKLIVEHGVNTFYVRTHTLREAKPYETIFMHNDCADAGADGVCCTVYI